MTENRRFKTDDAVQFILDGELKTGLVSDDSYAPNYKIRFGNMGITLHQNHLIHATKTVECQSATRVGLDVIESGTNVPHLVKRHIANNIGQFLFENDYIAWEVEPSWGETKQITGSVSVVVGVQNESA
ncbi:hypothetical protein [Paenilisteria newyorkensis]|uniref:hypothetical protein n=1 Tax=Listeria newyorkensis TaxID=1497681 RepID=UPI000741074F|nr:hypothetical protein [Listeria newyorkensis]